MRVSPRLRPSLCFSTGILGLGITLLWACDNPARDAPPVHPMVRASEELAAPGHSLEERMAAFVAGTSRQHEPTVPPLVGHLNAGRSADFQLTLRGTFCYVVVGAGEDSIEELDLELINDQDVLQLLDRDPSRMATLGLRDAICPMRPEAYRLRVTATRGQGAFEVRVFQASSI